MYTPRKIKASGNNNISEFISTYSFGLLVSFSLGSTHLPSVILKLRYRPLLRCH
ncbi:transcriptional regulator [Xenorhabdus miraniensis]|uniref:Transcriptional regulator n=1 Tax=Xenorhabdus miraniensis TaxID=351674 RepID=A0A2D0JNU3_9GAMM|nr:transcriptional regulator [Xenorhabdus miraniensis]